MTKTRPIFFGTFGLSALATVAAFLWAYATIGGAKHVLIVHYDAFKGIDFLGTRRDVLGIVIAAFAMTVVNFLLGNAFYSRERFVAWMIAAANMFVALATFLVIAIIIGSN